MPALGASGPPSKRGIHHTKYQIDGTQGLPGTVARSYSGPTDYLALSARAINPRCRRSHAMKDHLPAESAQNWKSGSKSFDHENWLERG